MNLLRYLSENTVLLLSIAGIIGVCLGSFVNTIIYRLPLMLGKEYPEIWQDVLYLPSPFNLCKPRSFCPVCKKPIPLSLNIPLLSYIFLRGESACCRNPIRPRYIFIETLLGILAIALTWHLGLTLKLAGSLILASALLALLCIDFDKMILPDQITLPIMWLGLLFNTFSIFTSPINALLGAIVGYLSFYSLAWVVLKVRKIDGLGRGDVKFLAMLGAWFGWQFLPSIVFIASAVGTVLGSIYILYTKKDLTIHLPFGPFLAFAGMVVLFFDQQIVGFQHLLLGQR